MDCTSAAQAQGQVCWVGTGWAIGELELELKDVDADNAEADFFPFFPAITLWKFELLSHLESKK